MPSHMEMPADPADYPASPYLTRRGQSRIQPARIDIKAGEAEGMVVIPEISSRYVVVVPERVGETARRNPTEDPYCLHQGVEELWVSVELKVAIPAVQMGDDRHPVPFDAVLPVSTPLTELFPCKA